MRIGPLHRLLAQLESKCALTPSVQWLIRSRKFKRENQIVYKGNNNTGRVGKLRCETCRNRHSKVHALHSLIVSRFSSWLVRFFIGRCALLNLSKTWNLSMRKTMGVGQGNCERKRECKSRGKRYDPSHRAKSRS